MRGVGVHRGSAFGRCAAISLALGAISLPLGTFAVGGCCDPKGQFELIATVVDGPTGQLIPTPAFGGDAAYAKCQAFYGQTSGGAGGGSQTSGPCLRWIVYADENGKPITIAAEGYESTSFDVPKGNADACGAPDTAVKTFRLKRAAP